MRITFCGHGKFSYCKDDEARLLEYLENRISGQDVEFYFGADGSFDSFVLSCCRKYKEQHGNARLIFVTPYISLEYQRSHIDYIADKCDEIIYPDLERVLPKFAIIYRNRYMVDKCDILVSYVNREYGGAYKTYSYAMKKNKEIYNLGRLK